MDNNMMAFIKSITDYGDATILHLYQTWLHNNPKEPETVHGNEAGKEVLGRDYDAEREAELKGATLCKHCGQVVGFCPDCFPPE